MTLDSPTLMAQLERVVEPCSLSMGNPMSICEMGLIEDLRFDGGVVDVVLCLTDPGCVNYGKIRQFITDVLKELPQVASVNVSLSTTELWTPDRVRRKPAAQTIQFVPRPARSQTTKGDS